MENLGPQEITIIVKGLLWFFGVLIAAGVGFFIWTIQRHLNEVRHNTKEIAALSAELSIYKNKTSQDLNHLHAWKRDCQEQEITWTPSMSRKRAKRSA